MSRDVVRVAVIAWLAYGVLFTFVTFAFVDVSEDIISAAWAGISFAAVITGLLAGRREESHARDEEPSAPGPQ